MTKAIQAEVAFLLERLEELDFSQSREDLYRDFCGHVWPSAERLAALVSDPSPNFMEKCPRCQGSGKWRHGICRACDGKGVLPSTAVMQIKWVHPA